MPAATYFTASGVDFAIEASVDSLFDDDSYLLFKTAVDIHTHRAGYGTGVGRVGSVAPATTGDVQITGDSFVWWGGTAGATRSAVDVEGTQTISGAKTFSAATTVVTALSAGTTPAASGTLRIPNTGSLKARNAGNSADVTVLTPAGANLSIGDSTLLNVLLPDGGSHHLGTAALRSVTNPTNAINIYNGTAPSGTLTNGATFYVASGEMRVMDSGGASSLLSPHDDDGYWVFDSTDRTGKRLLIDVEKLLRFLNDHHGLDFVHDLQEVI